jgi:RNA polymerase sigma-70 factor (ECF subfamily)
MAFHYTNNYSISQELTQDIFLKVYENLRSFRPDSGSLQNWIMRVGRNLIIDYYRAHKREKHVAGSDELETLDFKTDSPTPDPFENLYLKEKASLIQEGLEKLSVELKEAVALRDLQGLTYQEIADLLTIPEGTVKSRINRGRIELAKAMRQQKHEQIS